MDVAALAALLLLTAGCVQQRQFRFVPATTTCVPGPLEGSTGTPPSDQRPSLDCRNAQYKMAFIEFDEKGTLLQPSQELAARRLLELEKARAKDGKVITVVYVHGWKNNASEAAPGAKPKDVEKFQGALLELGYRAAQAAKATNTPPVPVVGIYLAWRGKTLMGPNWFTAASLWSRRNTANNIGDGPDLSVVLDRIVELTNRGNAKSRVLLVGHSFGARVLEHAIESGSVKLFDASGRGAVVRPRVDLVLYVNSANDSRLSMGRVQALRDSKLSVHHPDYDPAECKREDRETDEARANRCREYPLLVAITSAGDSATKVLLPLANTINGDRLTPTLSKQLPPLPATDTFADRPPSAGTVRKVAAGHFGFLQSHVAHQVECPAPPAVPTPEVKTTEETINEAVRRAVAAALGKGEDEAARKKREEAEEAGRLAEQQARYQRWLHPVCSAADGNCRFVFKTQSDTPACYQVDQRQAVDKNPPFNDTPFWIMSVEPTVIKDHGDIWNLSFVEMLGQLMAPRGFFDPGSERMQVRADAAGPK